MRKSNNKGVRLMRRLSSVLLAFVLVSVLCAPVFAADNPSIEEFTLPDSSHMIKVVDADFEGETNLFEGLATATSVTDTETGTKFSRGGSGVISLADGATGKALKIDGTAKNKYFDITPSESLNRMFTISVDFMADAAPTTQTRMEVLGVRGVNAEGTTVTNRIIDFLKGASTTGGNLVVNGNPVSNLATYEANKWYHADVTYDFEGAGTGHSNAVKVQITADGKKYACTYDHNATLIAAPVLRLAANEGNLFVDNLKIYTDYAYPIEVPAITKAGTVLDYDFESASVFDEFTDANNQTDANGNVYSIKSGANYVTVVDAPASTAPEHTGKVLKIDGEVNNGAFMMIALKEPIAQRFVISGDFMTDKLITTERSILRTLKDGNETSKNFDRVVDMAGITEGAEAGPLNVKGVSFKPYPTYKANEWYHIDVIYDFTEGTDTVSASSATVQITVPSGETYRQDFTPGIGAQAGAIRFQIQKGVGMGALYIDNLKVYKDVPEQLYIAEIANNTLKLENGQISGDLTLLVTNNTGAAAPCAALLCIYDSENVLRSVVPWGQQSLAEGINEVIFSNVSLESESAAGYTAKVVIFNGFSTINPLCGILEPTITEGDAVVSNPGGGI